MIQVPIERAVVRVPGGLMVVPYSSVSTMTLFPDNPRLCDFFSFGAGVPARRVEARAT